MKRRLFIKNTAGAGLVTMLTPGAIVNAFAGKPVTSLLEEFKNPPLSSGPYTWWHWMNGNVTKQGITLDLEAMKAAGLGGFQLFEAGSAIPKGPVDCLSDEWAGLIKHALSESERLGLEFAMHNCPGWSSSGGPWITPELSMQQLTWSEVVVDGGKEVKLKLPVPLSKLDFYKDAAVIAIPEGNDESLLFADSLKDVKVNGQSVVNRFNNGQQLNLQVDPVNDDNTSSIVFSFKKQVSLGSVCLETSGNGPVKLKVSTDGKTYTDVAAIHGGGGGYENPGDGLATASFATIQAKYIALEFTGKRHFSTIRLSSGGRFNNWAAKANFRNAGSLQTKEKTNGDVNMITSASVINLTGNLTWQGELNWNAPLGRWLIIRLGHTAVGQQNHSAPTAGTGLDCDKFSAKAFNFHFEMMFDKLMPSLREMAKKGKVGLLIDSYEMGLQNWTEKMPEDFKKIHRYDLIPYIAALTGRVVDSEEITELFLGDFRRAHAELMAQNYYGRFHELCKQNGIISYTEPYSGGPFDEMQVGQKLDISMGEFWAGNTVLWPNADLQKTVKLASSIAHATGETVVGAEAFTAEPNSGKWQQHPYALKAQGDEMFTRGLTRMIFHRYAHQPHPDAAPGMTMGPWGTHFDRTNTWWEPGKVWIKYLTRCQHLLKKGKPVVDIAYYTGEIVPGDTVAPGATQYPPPQGYDYDLVNKETLLSLSVRNGQLYTPKGLRYQILVIPERKRMSIAVLMKLIELVRAGANIVGQPPEGMVGLSDYLSGKAQFEKYVEQLWPLNVPENGAMSLGKGRVFQEYDVAGVLKAISVLPDFKFSSASGDAPVFYIHKQTENADIYFITNRRRSTEQLFCEFRIKEVYPQLWDADSGMVSHPLTVTFNNNSTQISLTLEPGGSTFVIFDKKTAAPVAYNSIWKDGKQVLKAGHFAASDTARYKNTFDNFTYTLWVKPEIDIALSKDEFFGKHLTDNYAVFPAPGDIFFGKGHTVAGFTVGRNGVVLYEGSSDKTEAVLFCPHPLSGWTQLSIVYADKVPSIYLNGKLIKTGERSPNIIHPGAGLALQQLGASYYNGDIVTLAVVPRALNSAGIEKLFADGLPEPEFKPLPENRDAGILIWEKGQYNFLRTDGKRLSKSFDNIEKPVNLSNNWTVKFPENSGAPHSINLKTLQSLHKASEPGVRYFSGTAIYVRHFDVPVSGISKGKALFLDLGRVEVMAAVTLNGRYVRTLWKPPYMVDISPYVRAGENIVEIKVTNLWPNRLIGDEQLPADNEYTVSDFPGKFAALFSGGIKKLPDWYTRGNPKPITARVAFATWKHYDKNSPLLESGMLGPVYLRTAIKIQS